MDTRHRVYYLVNLNQNHTKQGWWNIGWDSYGIRYNENLKKLTQSISSLKIRPVNDENREFFWYSMMISCKRHEQMSLVDLLDRLPDVNYTQIERPN